MGTKNNPGSYDCYANAEPDEPMFVLLARDPLAPILVEIWAKLREYFPSDSQKTHEARNCANAMRDWREENRELISAAKLREVQALARAANSAAEHAGRIFEEVLKIQINIARELNKAQEK